MVSQKPKNKQIEMMERARNGATFSKSELTNLIHGGEEHVKQRRAAFARVEKLLGTSDTSKLPRVYGNMNREDAYDEGLEWGKAAFEDMLHHKHSVFAEANMRYVLINSSPFGMNPIMFEPTIRLFASDSQVARWLAASQAGNIIGAYASTELGHGSFVRGMETTATFDPHTDEFVINPPTTTSAKFWPGAIGYSCTHAVVTARLIIGGEDHGPHFFMMKLRETDGKPVPNIKLGDVGMKMSYNGTCNGYAIFNNARIPRSDMLSKHARVTDDGKYEGAVPSQVMHSTLLMVRGIIVKCCSFQLAQALTIAARYSTVREQGMGPMGLGTTETAVISYKTQHYRILTHTASAYAILFASKEWKRVYDELRNQQERGNHGMLSYAHCLASGLKAWSSRTAADGAEDARKCCGGQGYLAISGLPEIVGAVSACATFEGENFVLWQQAARVLFKHFDALNAGNPREAYGHMQYLKEEYLQYLARGSQHQPLNTGRNLNAEAQLAMYRHRAFFLVYSVYEKVRKSSKAPIDAWNEHMLSVIAAARAHIEYGVLASFTETVNRLASSVSPSLFAVLSKLRDLFALSNILDAQGSVSFLESQSVPLSQLESTRNKVNELLEALLPNVVALTDAWDFTDASLCSALGMADGNVYETVMSWIEQMPINRRAWDENDGVYQPGWKTYIEPVLKAKL